MFTSISSFLQKLKVMHLFNARTLMFAIHKFPSRNIDYPDADRNKICRME